MFLPEVNLLFCTPTILMYDMVMQMIEDKYTTILYYVYHGRHGKICGTQPYVVLYVVLTRFSMVDHAS